MDTQQKFLELLRSTDEKNVQLALEIAKGNEDLRGYVMDYDSLYLHLNFGNYGGWFGEIQAHHIVKLNKLTRFDREAKKLEDDVPSGLGHLINLTGINLAHNQITHIPSSIGNLKKLRSLKLQNNLLESLPEEIGECTSLVYLLLSFNPLESLPIEAITHLTNLRELHLRHVQIAGADLDILHEKLPNCEIIASEATQLGLGF
jgi:Leucine-rich repeat (LRR) protein